MDDEKITRRDLLARLTKWSKTVVWLALGTGLLAETSCVSGSSSYTRYSRYTFTRYTVYSRHGSSEHDMQAHPKEGVTTIAYCNYADYCDSGCRSTS